MQILFIMPVLKFSRRTVFIFSAKDRQATPRHVTHDVTAELQVG